MPTSAPRTTTCPFCSATRPTSASKRDAAAGIICGSADCLTAYNASVRTYRAETSARGAATRKAPKAAPLLADAGGWFGAAQLAKAAR